MQVGGQHFRRGPQPAGQGEQGGKRPVLLPSFHEVGEGVDTLIHLMGLPPLGQADKGQIDADAHHDIDELERAAGQGSRSPHTR